MLVNEITNDANPRKNNASLFRLPCFPFPLVFAFRLTFAHSLTGWSESFSCLGSPQLVRSSMQLILPLCLHCTYRFCRPNYCWALHSKHFLLYWIILLYVTVSYRFLLFFKCHSTVSYSSLQCLPADFLKSDLLQILLTFGKSIRFFLTYLPTYISLCFFDKELLFIALFFLNLKCLTS